ncbi:MAG TPA: hypothetical protein VMT76_06950 [Puia sp.]|nr:hypothetical protein [Puia sp.]
MTRTEVKKFIKENNTTEEIRKMVNKHVEKLGLKLGKFHLINEKDDDLMCTCFPWGCFDEKGEPCTPE